MNRDMSYRNCKYVCLYIVAQPNIPCFRTFFHTETTNNKNTCGIRNIDEYSKVLSTNSGMMSSIRLSNHYVVKMQGARGKGGIGLKLSH